MRSLTTRPAIGTNPYHYADNDPLNRVDPLGLRSDDWGLSARSSLCVNVKLEWEWPPIQDNPDCTSYYTILKNMTTEELRDLAFNVGLIVGELFARGGAAIAAASHGTPSPFADLTGLSAAAKALVSDGASLKECGLSPIRLIPVLCVENVPFLGAGIAGKTFGHVILCAPNPDNPGDSCGNRVHNQPGIGLHGYIWDLEVHEKVHTGQFDEFGDALLSLAKIEDFRTGAGFPRFPCEHRYERPAYDADGRARVIC